MNTDEHGAAQPQNLTTKTRCERSQGRNLRVLRVSAVKFGVQALACSDAVQPEG